MRVFVCMMLCFFVASCSTYSDPQRTLESAAALSRQHPAFDAVHFTVRANCDYELFFDYEPMLSGGFYAYGEKDNVPSLLLIPKYERDDVLEIDWPIDYSVEEAVTLLNTLEDIQAKEPSALYSSVSLELTSNVLNLHFDADYDAPFFIVFTIDNVHYIAFQQNTHLVLYHEGHGLMATSETP